MGVRLSGLIGALAGLAAMVLTIPPASAQAPDPGPFAEMEAFATPRLSPDGRRVAAICAGRGKRSVCVFDLTGAERPRLYEAPERASVGGFYWASNRHVVIDVTFAYRAGISDAHQVYANERGVILNVETGETPIFLQNMRRFVGGSTNRVASMLTQDPDAAIAQVVVQRGDAIPDTGTRLAPGSYATIMLRVDLNTGRGERLSLDQTRDQIRESILTGDGRTVARSWTRPGVGIVAIVNSDGQTVYSAGEDLPPVSDFWVMENGAALGLHLETGNRAGLLRVDLQTGEMSPFALASDVPAGSMLIYSDWQGEPVGFAFMRDDLPDQTYFDPELRTLHASLSQALEGALPGARVALTSWSQDRMKVAVSATQRGRPAQHFLFDGATGDLSILGSQAPAFDAAPLGAIEAFRYAASDGLPIPAFLTLPPGKTRADGPFALVVLPHGGPFARDTAQFDWQAQYYASLGYAVLQPNFRGSSGYGREFAQAGHGEFGGRMIQDIADGAAHLVREGVAREGGYCAAGGSYGGYAALMLGLIDRENVRCIIAFAPVTDPVELVIRSGHNRMFWERYIGALADLRADPATISPARRAGEYAAPILLMHGAEDFTVPVSESRHLDRVTRRSGRVRYIEMPAIDHYLTTADSRRQLLSESAALLREHLPVE